jgi:hypothetical protein
MILLQSQSDSQPGIIIFTIVFRLIGIIVCATKANELNRNQVGWGFFGFCMPIVNFNDQTNKN